MSLDLIVWRTERPLGEERAHAVYAALMNGDTSSLVAHPSIDAFYSELVARYPELHTIPPAKIDDTKLCPWAATIDRAPTHLVLPCVWSVTEEVGDFIGLLQQKYRVSVYVPGEGKEYFPDE